MQGGEGTDLAVWVASAGLLALRIAPVFLFAPPFTLTKVPRLFLALFGLGIAMTLVAAMPDTARLASVSADVIAIGAVRELTLGMAPVVALNVMFGALYMAGRTVDIQAGFGLALLIDPTTRTQTPMVGTMLAYLAGAMFFAMNGHHDVLRFFAASLDLVPLGTAGPGNPLPALGAYLFVTFMAAFGVVGAVILILFLTDLMIALLARTVPQMNALLMGIQVKALLVIVALPFSVSLSGVLLVQMVTQALRTMAKLI